MIMRNIFGLIILSAALVFTSCKKEEEPVVISGCTDATAENYDAEAITDDGTCTYSYTAIVSFWQDFANSQSLGAASSSNIINIYLDGILVGSMLTSTYSAVQPPCGNGDYVYQFAMGSSQTKTVQFDLRYYDGSNWVVFQNGNLNLNASACTEEQIVF